MTAIFNPIESNPIDDGALIIIPKRLPDVLVFVLTSDKEAYLQWLKVNNLSGDRYRFIGSIECFPCVIPRLSFIMQIEGWEDNFVAKYHRRLLNEKFSGWNILGHTGAIALSLLRPKL